MEEQVVMDKLTIEHSVALTTIMCTLLYSRRLQFHRQAIYTLWTCSLMSILYYTIYFADLVFMVTQLSMKKGSLENNSHDYL